MCYTKIMKLKPYVGWINVHPENKAIGSNHVIHPSFKAARRELRERKIFATIKGKKYQFKTVQIRIAQV